MAQLGQLLSQLYLHGKVVESQCGDPQHQSDLLEFKQQKLCLTIKFVVLITFVIIMVTELHKFRTSIRYQSMCLMPLDVRAVVVTVMLSCCDLTGQNRFEISSKQLSHKYHDLEIRRTECLQQLAPFYQTLLNQNQTYVKLRSQSLRN